MKKLMIGTMSLFFISSAWAQTAPGQPRFYGIDHGIVEYSLNGTLTGKESLHFDQFGIRQYRSTNAVSQRWGMSNTITLNLGKEIIVYDTDKNLGQKKVDEILIKVLDARKETDEQLLSIDVLLAQGAEKVKEDTVLGYPCEVWQGPHITACVWNGILLTSEVKTLGGKVVRNATAIDMETPVDGKIFEIPEQVHFIDQDINQILLSQGDFHEHKL